MRRFSFSFFLFLFCAALPCRAADEVFPPGIGIHIADWRTNPGHKIASYPFETTDEDLKAMHEAGFRYVRSGSTWELFEPSPGDYRWDRIGDFIASAKANGLTPIVIIGDGNTAYTGGLDKPPTTPEQIQAFALFAATAAAHYGDGVIWEIWNEPDLAPNWKPEPDPGAYAALAAATCAAIKKTVPGAKVIGPALADVASLVGEGHGASVPLVKALLETSAVDCFDALSVHPYRHGDPGPERALDDYTKIRAFIDRATPAGRRRLPLVTSEWGFTTGEYAPEDQAAILVRAAIVNIMAGLPFGVFYEWRDTFHGENDPESHYGLFTGTRAGKPSWDAVKSFFPRLAGATFDRRLPLGKSSDYFVVLDGADGNKMLAFWTSRKDDLKRRVAIGKKDGGTPDGAAPQIFSLTTMPVLLDLARADEPVALLDEGP